MIFEQLLEVVAALFFAFLLSALKGGLYAGSMAGKYRALSVNSRSFESINDTEITEDKMHFDQVDFGYRIRTLRKRHSLTQDQLAAQLGISTDHLGKIELGKRGVSLDLLAQLAEHLNVSVDYLLNGTAHRPEKVQVLIAQIRLLLDELDNQD